MERIVVSRRIPRDGKGGEAPDLRSTRSAFSSKAPLGRIRIYIAKQYIGTVPRMKRLQRKRYIIKTFYRRSDSSDRVRLPQDKLRVFLVDRFSYRVPRVAIILLWKYPVEVKENRRGGKKRKKKEEREKGKSGKSIC